MCHSNGMRVMLAARTGQSSPWAAAVGLLHCQHGFRRPPRCARRPRRPGVGRSNPGRGNRLRRQDVRSAVPRSGRNFVRFAASENILGEFRMAGNLVCRELLHALMNYLASGPRSSRNLSWKGSFQRSGRAISHRYMMKARRCGASRADGCSPAVCGASTSPGPICP